MEKWLFLHNESRKKIMDFAYSLDTLFPGSWEFSRFVPHKTARQPVEEAYKFEDCFKTKGELRDQKLVVGQIFSKKEVIRSCFRNQDIWADFMVENTNENYTLVDSLFLPAFGYKIENYPHQQESQPRYY